MKILYLILCLFLLTTCNPKSAPDENSSRSEGQENEKVEMVSIHGTIFDASDSTPISGAFVMLKGTTTGTITDPDGKFLLRLEGKPKKLTIASDGYSSVDKEIDPEADNLVYLSPITEQ
jgi:hypothetical protein